MFPTNCSFRRSIGRTIPNSQSDSSKSSRRVSTTASAMSEPCGNPTVRPPTTMRSKRPPEIPDAWTGSVASHARLLDVPSGSTVAPQFATDAPSKAQAVTSKNRVSGTSAAVNTVASRGSSGERLARGETSTGPPP